MDEMLARILAFDRAVRVRGAQRVTELPEGVVVRHARLPIVHHLNALLLDSPLPAELEDLTAIRRLADEHLSGVDHRQLVVDDAEAAERLAPALLAAGWTRQRVIFMIRVTEPDRRPPPGLVSELDEATVRELGLALLAEEAPRRSDATIAAALAKQLVAGQEALRAGTQARCFGAGDGGRPVSICTLFLSLPEFAMIEEVGTLAAHRGRGLARAVIGAAIDAAQALGCETIFVPADADDWPQLLYLKLGFEPVGRQVSFTLRDLGR